MNSVTVQSFTSLALAEQVAQLTRVDAKTRQQLILSARHSLELTRSLSVELLFYTLKEIGLTDSIGLLTLAAPEQVRDMMDLDCWRRDQLDERRVLTWLLLLDEAGSSKLAEWLLHADTEVLVLLVKRHLEIVRKVDLEDDFPFDPSQYFTFDDQYLLRFVGEDEPILHLALERLRVLDYDQYRAILEQSLFDLETALEEEAFRWRTARLADRGYPAHAETQELFRLVAPEQVHLASYRRAAVEPLRFVAGEEVTPPDHALTLLNAPDSFFLRALSAVSQEELEQIAHELAHLTNHVVIAEGGDLGELSEVRRCVELTHHYLNIGLAYSAHSEEQHAVQLLHNTQLHPFFQIGLSLILRLRQQGLYLDATLRHEGLTTWEQYLDTPFREACSGVQRRPPLFFGGVTTPGEIFYRGFQTLGEIEQVGTILTQVPHWFAVMRRWELLPASPADAEPTLGLLWNTAFAHWMTHQKIAVGPLRRNDLRLLQRRLAPTALEEKSAAFVTLASAQLQLTAEEIAAMHALATHAREKLRETLSLYADTVDLRFVEGVLMEEGGKRVKG